MDNASDELTVVPSTETETAPVGTVETALEFEDTVMLTTSLAPEAGVVVAAVRTVVEAVVEDVLEGVGQTDSRL